MNIQYDITDITDRLEDLDTYLDDIERKLVCAQDAAEDMRRYAQDIADLDTMRTLAEAFADDGLPARLADYIAAHRHAWDHPTEQLFKRLAELLTHAESIQATSDTPLLTGASDAVSYQLSISPAELATIKKAITHELDILEWRAEVTPYNRNLRDFALRLAKLPSLD